MNEKLREKHTPLAAELHNRHRKRTDRITTADVAGALGLSDRMARVLLGRWVEDGWLEVADPSRRARAYVLSASYRQFIGSLSAMGGG